MPCGAKRGRTEVDEGLEPLSDRADFLLNQNKRLREQNATLRAKIHKLMVDKSSDLCTPCSSHSSDSLREFGVSETANRAGPADRPTSLGQLVLFVTIVLRIPMCGPSQSAILECMESSVRALAGASKSIVSQGSGETPKHNSQKHLRPITNIGDTMTRTKDKEASTHKNILSKWQSLLVKHDMKDYEVE